MDLKTLLKNITGIGSYTSFKLSRLNLNTIEDLIYHFPFRYDDFSNNTSAMEAKVGDVVSLQGEIWSIKNTFTRYGKVLTQAIFNDGTSPINLTWFNQSWLVKQIKTGDRIQVSGKLTKYKSKLSIIMPRWEKLPEVSTYSTPGVGQLETPGLHTGKLVAVYPETEGLSSNWFRKKIDGLKDLIEAKIDPLPDPIRKDMLPLCQALKAIHFPDNWQDVEKARERLGFDELFFVNLATQKARLEWKNKSSVQPLKVEAGQFSEFKKSLPFELTKSQIKVIDEILADLKSGKPMNRMIQGEVGSGKTVVAAFIAFIVHKNNLKTLFMAPTEILAFQHFETLKKLLEPFGIKIGIYTGSRKFAERKGEGGRGKEKTKLNPLPLPLTPNIIIGTHALLSSKLSIPDVGLIIVDEQQRFGVEQRTELRKKARVPHFLTMTATPIPRTIALTLYGDLDFSVIDEMPKDRIKIKTYVVPENKRNDAYKFIEKQIKAGGQAYIITPLIELSETMLTAKAAVGEFKSLQEKVFPALKLGLLHGRMKGKEKDTAMSEFKSHKLDILVSTSVVEVGVDVPNATIMVIEGADRFGLAQLHQLRGRVGRGIKQSFCLLFAQSKESTSRLKNMEKIDNGLKLAELDLKIRGSGEIFGKLQSGRLEFKIASFSDLALVEKTKKAAGKLLQDNPTLDKYPQVKAKLRDLAGEVMPD